MLSVVSYERIIHYLNYFAKCIYPQQSPWNITAGVQARTTDIHLVVVDNLISYDNIISSDNI